MQVRFRQIILKLFETFLSETAYDEICMNSPITFVISTEIIIII